MITLDSRLKIFLACGHTDMRKGVLSLSLLATSLIEHQDNSGALFVFRGRSADKIKILWWDGQGFCLFYKCLDKGKFIWPATSENISLSITKAQLSMLVEGIDWRTPKWSNRPMYTG